MSYTPLGNLAGVGEKVNALGSVSGNPVNIDLNLGNVVTATIGGTTTFAFINPKPSGICTTFTIKLRNAGANITWPTSVDWAGGSPPTLTASGYDILSFMTVDGGTTWYGVLAGADFK